MMRAKTAALLLLALLADAQQRPPHIISILQDDLGYFDTGINNNSDAATYTGNITSLARAGIVLSNHYVHWHCSPTRRSLLTGRLPLHHGEQLSKADTDDVDLRMSWLPQKLKLANYTTHWFGKMHTGYKSMAHLGVNQGFDNVFGTLLTGGAYTSAEQRWQNLHPVHDDVHFENKPSGCGSRDDSDIDLTTAKVCPDSLLMDVNFTCPHSPTFVDAVDDQACCLSCANVSCSHWSWNKGTHNQCSLFKGKKCKRYPNPGSVSAAPKHPPGPGPAPGPKPAKTCATEYSTNLYGQLALQAINEHDAAASPLYIHLCFQAVHVPYNTVPNNPLNSTYHGMLWDSDVYIGKIVALLKQKSMWASTVIFYASDNGGTSQGINFPLRGEKHSNWEGGIRAATFVSGGYVPASLRGSVNSINFHIVDWMPTFCALAGLSAAQCRDDPPVPPLPVDIADPQKDIYGNSSFPPLDGTNIWPMLLSPQSYNISSAHAALVVSKEVLIAGRYKLLVAQPHFKSQNCGWKQPNGTWEPMPENGMDLWPCVGQDLGPGGGTNVFPGRGTPPCLFDLRADKEERVNLAGAEEHRGLVQQLWAQLNRSVLTGRDCSGWSGPVRSFGGQCSPPELLGPCDSSCAASHWESVSGAGMGPVCGVPGCGGVQAA